MDHIEKISLKVSNEKDAILDDDTLSDEQKVVLYNEIFKKQLLQKQPKAKPQPKLLSRVWPSIENLPKQQQNHARDLIRKIENYPNLSINHRFEMVYKEVPQHGTNIIQLILNHVGAGDREILPGQDLLENIAAYKERLVYTPQRDRLQYPDVSWLRNLINTPKSFSPPKKPSLQQLSDPSKPHTSTPHRPGDSVTRKPSKNKKRAVKLLRLRRSINKTPYSPVSNHTRGRHGYQEHEWP